MFKLDFFLNKFLSKLVVFLNQKMISIKENEFQLKVLISCAVVYGRSSQIHCGCCVNEVINNVITLIERVRGTKYHGKGGVGLLGMGRPWITYFCDSCVKWRHLLKALWALACRLWEARSRHWKSTIFHCNTNTGNRYSSLWGEPKSSKGDRNGNMWQTIAKISSSFTI